jgi:hypothetical protein
VSHRVSRLLPFDDAHRRLEHQEHHRVVEIAGMGLVAALGRYSPGLKGDAGQKRKCCCNADGCCNNRIAERDAFTGEGERGCRPLVVAQLTAH